jgi:hypothetical protein
MIEPNDDLGDILTPQPGRPLTDLREKLLRQTEARLVHQRWARRYLRSGVVAAVFVLGASTGWLVRPVLLPGLKDIPQPEIVFVPVVVPVPVIVAPESESTGTKEISKQLVGSQTELQAEQEDDPTAAAKLYKTAGDLYLRDENYSNATRCYRLYIVRAGDAALSIGPDDSWLLTSLKNAAFQEKSRAQKTAS